MSRRERPTREPQRLMHDRELGQLLSSANAVYRAGLDESGAFQRLSERLEAPERRARWHVPAFAAALGLAAGAVVALGVFDAAPSHVALGPEISPPRRTLRAEHEPIAPLAAGRAEPAQLEPDREARAQRVAAPVEVRPEPERSARDERAENDAERLDVQRPEDGAKREVQLDGMASASAKLQENVKLNEAGKPVSSAQPVTGAGAAPAMSASVEAPSSADGTLEARVDCSELVGKDARAAEHCYALRATESSGLGAEAALYELARLRRDVQRDAKGALAALNEYRDRFPRGSLRSEVGLSRVELLSELGRSREALQEAEALLGPAKERAAELYLLRGDIFRRDLADFGRAAQEYAKAEKFGGGFGAEATRLRGLSLEALGDVQGALAAYRRYLSGPDQPRKGEVNRRVEALTSSQRGTAP